MHARRHSATVTGSRFLIRFALLFLLAIYFMLPSHGAAPAPESKTALTSGKAITDDEIKKMLVGRQLFLRGLYLDNDLEFNEHGGVLGHPSVGSFTLSQIQIRTVSLSKHKLELEGDRYGIHFLGGLGYTDNKDMDLILITAKKKAFKVSIDREQILVPKIKKEKVKKDKKGEGKEKAATGSLTAEAAPRQSPQREQEAAAKQARTLAEACHAQETSTNPNQVTTTCSPGHAADMLRSALQTVFADGLDARMREQMPGFWKAYYDSKSAGGDGRIATPRALRVTADMSKPRILSTLDPETNEFAQKKEITGMALYHAVIAPDGTATDISVERPIGFGLDENAVKAIHEAKFQPALKNGEPVAAATDLVVTFRIFSKRTMGNGMKNASNTDERPKPTPTPPASNRPMVADVR